MAEEKHDFPKRKRPAHFPPVDRFNESTIIFLTVCTRQRRPLLARSAAHHLLISAWRAAVHWHVGRYVIMPDHVHLFCAPAQSPGKSLAAWIAFWRNQVMRGWPREEDKPVWQKDYWDTQLRRGDSYSAKWQYVEQNPVRAGLVKRAEEWPYQGELNSLMWFGR